MALCSYGPTGSHWCTRPLSFKQERTNCRTLPAAQQTAPRTLAPHCTAALPTSLSFANHNEMHALSCVTSRPRPHSLPQHDQTLADCSIQSP